MPQSLDHLLLERCFEINVEAYPPPSLQDLRSIEIYLHKNGHNDNHIFESKTGDMIEFHLDDVEQARAVAYNTLLYVADKAIRPERMIGPIGTPEDAIRAIEIQYRDTLTKKERKAITQYANHMIPIYEEERAFCQEKVNGNFLRPIGSALFTGGIAFSTTAFTLAPYMAAAVGFGVAGVVGLTIAAIESRYKQVAIALATNFSALDEKAKVAKKRAEISYVSQSTS